MLRQIERYPKKRSFYFKTGVIAIGYGIFACLMTLVFGDIGEFISTEWIDWFLPCLAIPAFIGHHISGATYFGREADLLSQQKPVQSYEKSGTLLGIVFGLTVGIGLVIVRGAGHIFTGGALDIFIEIFEIGATVLGAVGSFGGFGNRLGSAIQNSQGEGFFERLSSVIVKEKKPILVGAAVGFTFSLTTWLLGAALLTGFGFVSFVTGGLPLWVMGGLFVLSYTSSFASGTDYFSRANTYIQATYFNNEKAQETMKGRYYQHKYAAIGVGIGIVLASAIIITLLVTQPYLVALIAIPGIFFACTGTLGGICSRIGRILFDEKPFADVKPVNTLEPRSEPGVISAPMPITEKPLLTAELSTESTPILLSRARSEVSPAPTLMPRAKTVLMPTPSTIFPDDKQESEFDSPLHRSNSSTLDMLSAFTIENKVQETQTFLPADEQRDEDSIAALLKDNNNLSLINTSCGVEDRRPSAVIEYDPIALEV